MKKKILSMHSFSELTKENAIAFEAELERELEGKEFDSFVICLHFPGEVEEGEKELLKKQFNSIVGTGLIEKFGTGRDFAEAQLEIRINLFKMEFEFWFRPIFIFGRYRKLERGLPQTRWDCTACRGKGCEKCNFTGKKHFESVQELVCREAESAFCASGSKFHGCGREDVDARMLGNGRPFVIELVCPETRQGRISLIGEKINLNARGKIEVLGLRFSDKEEMHRVKSGAFEKTYGAKVEFGSEIKKEKLEKACAELEGVELSQDTPNRVMHRRADIERKRKIIYARIKEFFGKGALLEIRAEHGTYIKEFVSGDDGRTRPSLSEKLGTQAKVSELDVIAVHDDLG